MKTYLKSKVEVGENPTSYHNLHLGVECNLKFNLKNYIINEIDDRIQEIAEVDLLHFKSRTIFYFLDSLVKSEQLPSVNEFFNQAINFLNKEGCADLSANLEFGIVTPKNNTKQILFQFGAEVPENENLVHGKMIDISHFKAEDPPQLFIINKDGRIEKAIKNSLLALQNSGLDLSQKDINVILLKSKGLRAKEIAMELGISNLSVYSIIRDIKQKTGMELLPLVVYLKKVGVLR